MYVIKKKMVSKNQGLKSNMVRKKIHGFKRKSVLQKNIGFKKQNGRSEEIHVVKAYAGYKKNSASNIQGVEKIRCEKNKWCQKCKVAKKKKV